MLERQAAAALSDCGMRGKRLLVAVSGGPDSLALLHALWGLRGEFGLALAGAHFNHRLRGADSDADAEFAAAACDGLGAAFFAGSGDVAAYRRERGLSLEDAARRLRYGFLADAAARWGADAVALGHTADDQAETVLMNIMRGSGLAGLRGMRAMSERRDGALRTALFRPLLGTSRADTVAYCAARGLSPRHDASNSSPKYLRNRVRMDLLPSLEEYNPSARGALARLSAAAAEDDDYIESQAAAAWERVAAARGDGVALDAAAFGALHPALQARLLRRAVASVKGDAQNLARSHADDMRRLMGGGAGKSIDLPGGVVFRVGYGEALICPAVDGVEARSPLPPIGKARRLRIPGETRVGVWLAVAEVRDVGGAGAGLGAGVWASGFGDWAPEKANAAARWDKAFALSEIMDYDAVRGRDADAGDVSAAGSGVSGVGDGVGGAAGEGAIDGGGIDGAADCGVWLRNRRPGDRFQPLGMKRSKKLKDFMSDERMPREWRDGAPLLATRRGVACALGWRIADWARATNRTRLLLRVRLTRVGADG